MSCLRPLPYDYFDYFIIDYWSNLYFIFDYLTLIIGQTFILFYFILWFKVFYIIDPFFYFIVRSLYDYCEPQHESITPFNL